jgi:hypothetical protein
MKPQVIRVVPIEALFRQGYFIPGGRLRWFLVFGLLSLRSVN